LRSKSFSETIYLDYRHYLENEDNRFNPMDFYVREKQGKLVAQYRPYFIYFANLFFDGKNSNLLLILPALASLMGVLIFYRLTRLFVPEKESFYLALFLGLASPFVTYSFRFLDVNIAVCMLLLSTYLFFKYNHWIAQASAFLIGMVAFIVFKSESILYIVSFALGLTWASMRHLSAEISRKNLIFLIATLVLFVVIWINVEHLQKHLFSVDVILNNYLNIPKRLRVINAFFFSPMPFGLGLETLLGKASPFHLTTVATLPLIVFFVARRYDTSVLIFLSSKRVAACNLALLSLALIYLLSHESSKPVVFNRYSEGLLAAIVIVALVMLMQALYPIIFNRLRRSANTLVGKECVLWATIFVLGISLLLTHDGMVSGMFSSMPILVLIFASTFAKRRDHNFEVLRFTCLAYFGLAIFAPTQGGYQWGPRYLQAIIPIAILLSWLSVRDLSAFYTRCGITSRPAKWGLVTLVTLTVLMTMKGVLFIVTDVQERHTNELALKSLAVDFVFHKDFSVHYPRLIKSAYTVGRAEDIPAVLDLIARDRLSFAIYNLDAQEVEEQLIAINIPYFRTDTGRTIIDASPNSNQKHEITIFSIQSRPELESSHSHLKRP